MPRTARAILAGHCYHVINRGNNHAVRFHSRADYQEFLRLMADATDRVPVRLIGACLMPNHVHLLLWPDQDHDIARWTHWLFATYSRRYHRRYGTSGRLWENRYRAFAIQGDGHLLIVLRYVERNALRAHLTNRAEHWEWGSLNWRLRPHSPVELGRCPVTLPADWAAVVNAPHTEEEIAAVRNCVNRQCPFGSPDWVAQKAVELGLEQTIAPLGRPRRPR